MNKTKIVFLGAGSISFGMSMLRDLFTTTEFSGSTLTLVTNHADSASRVAKVAQLLNQKLGAGLKIEHTTDRRAALDGAGFVVNATAIERSRLWKLDFEVPKKYGIRQTLGENGGPGGLANSKNFGPIRAVLFDKDGTLVDFQRTWGPAVHEVMQHLAGGNRAAYERLAAASRFVEAEQRFLPDSPLIGEPTQGYGALWADALGRTSNATFFAEIDRLMCDATTLHLAAIGNPREQLTALASRGYRLGMITNDAEANARAHARKLGLDGILGFIVGYDSGFGAKPGPGPVLAFAQAVDVAPAEIVVVGDTVLDVAAAHAAGAIAIGVLTGPASAGSLAPCADALIASHAELAAWLDSR